MGERINLKPIWKSTNPEELLVYHASSLEDEIRFYLNQTQYIVAKDNKDGICSVIFKEEEQELQNEKQNTEGILDYINRNIFISFVFSLIIAFILCIVLFTPLIDMFFLLLVNSIHYLLINILFVATHEYMFTSQSLKSKHSAEHMIVNFLEQNKRLPKNLKEFQESSRFSTDCGSRKKIREFIGNFIQSIFAAILSIVLSILYFKITKTDLLSYTVFAVTYFVIFYGIGIFIHKYHKLNFIICPIENSLNYIIQCANTTKKVKDTDLRLAYQAAKYWLQIVYPEFYDKTEDDNDIFGKIIKVDD